MRTALVTVLLTAPALFGAAIVDQSSLPGAPGGTLVSAHESEGYGVTSAQVVKAGLTGQLTRVDLPIWNYSGFDGNFVLEIWNVSGNAPVEPPTTPLGSASVSASDFTTFTSLDLGNWATFDFSGANVWVTADEQFALVLKANPSGNDLEGYWFDDPSSSYTGGAGYTRGGNDAQTNLTNWTSDLSNSGGPSGWDFYFQTYVDTGAQTPEPATWALVSAAFLAIGARRLRA